MSFIKKFYKIIITVLIVLFIAVIMLNKTTIKTDGYSVDNVYDTIKELSSDKYMGRRFGTKENTDAVKYIEEQFRSMGLKPAGEDNTFLRSYGVIAKKNSGVPVIEVLDEKNMTVKSYKFAEDFTERGTGFSCPGELTSEFGFVEYPYGIKSNKFNSDKEIAVMYAIAMGENQTQSLYMELKKAGCKALIILVPDNYNNIGRTYSSVGMKSLQKSGYEIPTLYLSENLKEEILDYSRLGYKIHLKATTDGTAVTISDVMGMIPGKTDDYLFITAHLDHVGASIDGKIYPGALDNASGTAAMLEIARYIKSQNRKPNKNIVFVAFNGEEGGTLGSLNYVRYPIYPLYKTTVINLDMIGAGEDVPIKASYIFTKGFENSKSVNVNPASKLRYQLKTLARELNIPYKEQYDACSDHVPFNSYGVSAITIEDNDTSKIHTTEDDINNIGKENIDRDMKLIMNYISYFVYSNGGLTGNKLLLLDAETFIETQYSLIIGIIAVFILLLIVYRTRIAGLLKGKVRIPLLTFALIILAAGIISYFPIRYPYAPIAASKDALGLFTEGILSIFKAPLLWPFYFLYIMPGVIIFAIIKQRQLRWDYKGNGEELDIAFYAAMLVTVILSVVGSTLLFNKEVYYPITPDFARAFNGKLFMHLIIGGIAYLFWRVMRYETGNKNKGYKSLVAYALIFIVLLSSFYMPIAVNKYVINANSTLIKYSGEGEASE